MYVSISCPKQLIVYSTWNTCSRWACSILLLLKSLIWFCNLYINDFSSFITMSFSINIREAGKNFTEKSTLMKQFLEKLGSTSSGTVTNFTKECHNIVVIFFSYLNFTGYKYSIRFWVMVCDIIIWRRCVVTNAFEWVNLPNAMSIQN